MIDTTGRHSSTQAIARWFDSGHLDREDARAVSRMCETLAASMIRDMPDGPELTTGLRKLLEAKDCFVRSVILLRDEMST